MIYYLAAIIIIYLIFIIYIKVRYRFWSSQPAFHVYDALYWLKPPGIIKYDMPINNRYVNLNNMITYDVEDMSDKLKKKCTNFIQNNYLNLKNIKFIPKEENIFPYFSDLDGKSYLSYYKGDGEKVLKDQMAGIITSRPVTIRIRKNTFISFLVDFMCIAKEYRKKGLAEEMIQTHLFNQVKKQPNIITCFFKRETDLTLIVPLVIYDTYVFNFTQWDLKKISSKYTILKITPQSFDLFYHFLSTISSRYLLFVVPTYSNLINLVKSNNYLIYVIMLDNEVMSCYIFKHAATEYDEKKSVICISSIKGECNDEIFKFGFSNVLSLLDYSILILEDLTDNSLIIKSVLDKHKPLFKSPAAYYFHNYADRPVEKEKTCLLI